MADSHQYRDDNCIYIGGDPRLDTDEPGVLDILNDKLRFTSASGTVLAWPLSTLRHVGYQPGRVYTADELNEARREAKSASEARGWELAFLRLDDIPPGVLVFVEDPEGVSEDGWPVHLGCRSEYFARVLAKRLRLAAKLATPHHELSLERLVSQGEGECLEFKERLTRSCAKSIGAFLNTSGGTLLLGVADNGTIVGIRADGFTSSDEYTLRVQNLIRNKLTIASRDSVHVEVLAKQAVCRIRCLPASEPIYCRAESGNPDELYIRRGPSTERLEGRNLLEYCRRRFGTQCAP